MTRGIPGLEIPQIIRDKCPIWTGRLENEDAYTALENRGKFDPYVAKGKGTCIDNYGCCIAGEANDFKAVYKTAKGNNCSTCRTYADSLYADLTTLGYAQASKPKPRYRRDSIMYSYELRLRLLDGNNTPPWWTQPAPSPIIEEVPDYDKSLDKFQETLNRYAMHLERVHNPKEEVVPQEHLRIPIEVKNK